MWKSLLWIGFITGGLPFIWGQSGVSGVRSLNTPAQEPLQAAGITLRFAAFETAASPQSGYLLLENLQPMGEPFDSWSLSSFTTFTASGSDMGESGVLTLDRSLQSNPSRSNIVGVLPLTDPLSVGSSTPLDAAFAPPSDAETDFLHGRLLASFGTGSEQNIGYQVHSGGSLALASPLSVASGGSTLQVPDLNLYSTGNGTSLSGVSGSSQNPVLAFRFLNVDQNNNGLADPVDPDKIWWETARVLEGDWRITDEAENLESGFGVIFDPEWPWIYAYQFQGGKWLWIYDGLENPDPSSFWAFNEDGYWAFIDTNNGNYYYHWDLKQWFSFP